MKKYVICLLAMVFAIATSSFNVVKKNMSSSKVVYKWYDYQGGLLEMCNPDYFTPDDNNYPDCPPVLGIIYCEIKALPSQSDPAQPDLTTIVDRRFRPLL